jgi:hypothetical protein
MSVVILNDSSVSRYINAGSVLMSSFYNGVCVTVYPVTLMTLY